MVKTASNLPTLPPRRKGALEMPINQALGTDASLYRNLPFSMNFVQFARSRARTERVAFGDWLATLDNHRLDDLLNAYRIFSTSDVRDTENASVRNDLLTLLMTVLLAESGKRSMNFRSAKMPTHIDSMGVAIRVETWRRKGWVTLGGDLAILQRRVCTVEPTALMRAEAPDLYDHLQVDHS